MRLNAHIHISAVQCQRLRIHFKEVENKRERKKEREHPTNKQKHNKPSLPTSDPCNTFFFSFCILKFQTIQIWVQYRTTFGFVICLFQFFYCSCFRFNDDRVYIGESLLRIKQNVCTFPKWFCLIWCLFNMIISWWMVCVSVQWLTVQCSMHLLAFYIICSLNCQTEHSNDSQRMCAGVHFILCIDNAIRVKYCAHISNGNCFF